MKKIFLSYSSLRYLCAFAPLRDIFAFWDLNYHFLPKNGRKLLVSYKRYENHGIVAQLLYFASVPSPAV
ncbi:MAG: hypothetical protein ACE5G1_13050, partial [bacterium]